jgi:hypothetical protein
VRRQSGRMPSIELHRSNIRIAREQPAAYE